MADGQNLLIGEAAKQADLNPKTIRFYEEIGLVAPAGRTPKGYRLFDERTVSRLGFIKKAQSLGFTLTEIGEILALSDGGLEPCGHVESQVARKIEDIEDRITELERLKASLHALLQRRKKEDEAVAVCPRIEGVEQA